MESSYTPNPKPFRPGQVVANIRNGALFQVIGYADGNLPESSKASAFIVSKTVLVLRSLRTDELLFKQLEEQKVFEIRDDGLSARYTLSDTQVRQERDRFERWVLDARLVGRKDLRFIPREGYASQIAHKLWMAWLNRAAYPAV